MAGTNVVRSFSLHAGDPGTTRGTNSFQWDGMDTEGKFVPEGLYGIVITAATDGYPVWTQISQDTNAGNVIYSPYGIAVNRNTNSFHYGRVFVGNALPPDSGAPPDQHTGIYLFNADGSPADEGGFSDVYPWAGIMYSPWKMEVSADDFLYVNDWRSYGVIVAFDQDVTSYKTVLNSSNWPKTGDMYANLSGPAVTGTVPGAQIWLADVNTSIPSQGIVRWTVTADGTVAPDDTGTIIVAAGTNSDLSVAPFDVAVDKNGAVYTIQRIYDSYDPSYRVMRFPASDGSSGPMTNAEWKAGPGLPAVFDTNGTFTVSPVNPFDNAYGIAVNPEATLVAVAARGIVGQNGGMVLLDANSGAVITNIDSGLNSSYTDVAWDNVGNVYGTQEEIWRVFSPPGPNQSTTTAAISIQVLNSLTPPQLASPQWTGNQLQFTISGQPSVRYLVDASLDLINWIPVTTNSSASALRTVQLSPPDPATFYRVRVSP